MGERAIFLREIPILGAFFVLSLTIPPTAEPPRLRVAAEQISQAARFPRGFAPMLAAPFPKKSLLRQIFFGSPISGTCRSVHPLASLSEGGVCEADGRSKIPYFLAPSLRARKRFLGKAPVGL